MTSCDSFGVEHIPNEINKYINNRNIISNIFKIQVYNQIMCVYFCVEFIDSMSNRECLADFIYLFISNYQRKP